MRSTFRHLLRSPLYLAQIFTSAKDFAGNPLLGSRLLNAMGLHVARRRLAHMLSEARRAAMAHKVPKELRNSYAAQGFAMMSPFLTQDEFEQVKRDVLQLRGEVIEMKQLPAVTRRINLDARSCDHLPGLKRLLANPMLLNTLRYVAGYGGAPIIAVQCIHNNSDQPDGAHDPQTDWHSDTFHSTAKAWLFLHDVGPADGPFAYCTGSHANTQPRLAWEKRQSLAAAKHVNRLHAKGSFRASQAELAEMGFDSSFTAAVPANTLVVADTSGFHRRSPSSQPTVRVEIYLSLRRNPFFAGLYPSLLGLPWVKKHWAGTALEYYKARAPFGKSGWVPTSQHGLREDERKRLGAQQL